uniref:RWD domain-containing protein 3 n=1 Tax=Micromonas pusilla TaxID=38833 RepID=A0A7S0IJL4_MICPS|mmetsp:Transcript_8002/g.32909  ORF Transcript_8002/g.32909 Transcript_8002/m.32909 type:complete len:377 (+) Transcript_8002:79-1209(+)
MSSASAQPPSVCAAELAQRRLMECECLAAMYGPMAGDAGDRSSFEVVNPDVERELRAAVDAWEASGDSVAAALSVRAVSAPLRVSLTLAVPSASGGEDEPGEPGGSGPDRTPGRGTVTLGASLPTNYPAADAPALELSATHLSRDAITRVLRELRSLASERTARAAPDGFECLSELAQAAADLSAAAAAADDEARRRAAESNLGANGDGDGGDEGRAHAVVRIDHMNDGKGYTKTLRRWSRELAVDARVFYARESSGEVPKGSEGSIEGPPSGPQGRVEGVYAVLGGDGDDVRSFLTRLRTEFVDVDARGARCKERKSTVMCLRRAGVVKPGEERVPRFDGFECEGYVGADGLEDALARFNLLHVGAGAQRFQPAG